MKIIFRVDASIEMGTGHVMRCLTLADALTQAGAECHFICREHPGHLNALITERGHIVYSLPYIEQHKQRQHSKAEELAHASWLGATQEQDLESCIPILKLLQPDWLIVDHYAINKPWHQELRAYCQKIMVIDDLADRQHDCDLLLDQTFGRSSEDYLPLVPQDCQVLCGAHYALLRPEFAQWRDYSLKRRAQGQLEHLLINLGGVDKDNITTEILQALANTALPDNCRITVVMGATAPWVERVQQQAALMPWPTEVKVGVNNMAELMANSDLAIGAAGATSWERCCLGLPTIMVVIAENQKYAALQLEKRNIVRALHLDSTLKNNLKNILECFLTKSQELYDVSFSSSYITEGKGVSFVSSSINFGGTMNNESNALGLLRPIRKIELELILSWRNSPKVRENMYTHHVISKDEHLLWWDSVSNREDCKYFMYELNNEPLGVVYIVDVSNNNKNAAWGFYAAENSPRGIGSKMEYLALEYAFNELKLHKLYCEVLEFNNSVIKLHKKFGFVEEGVFVNHHFDGFCFKNIHRLSIFRDRWLELRETILKKITNIKIPQRT